MIRLTYETVQRTDFLDARKILPKTFRETQRNLLRSTNILRYSPRMVRQFLQRGGLHLSPHALWKAQPFCLPHLDRHQ